MTFGLHLLFVLLFGLDVREYLPALDERHNQEEPSFLIESIFQLDDKRVLELHEYGLLFLHLLQEELPFLA